MFRRRAQGLSPGLPHCLKKRRLLNNREANPAVCRDLGEKFLALGWWEDALDFFQKAQDASGLARIRDHAVESGDAYLLARLGPEPDPGLWRRLGERALALGKLQFARQAFARAGDVEKSAAVKSLVEEQGSGGAVN